MFSACYWEGWPTGADLPGFTARKAWTKAQLYRESDGWVDRTDGPPSSLAHAYGYTLPALRPLRDRRAACTLLA